MSNSKKENLKIANILAIELARANTYLHFFTQLEKERGLPAAIKDFWDYTLSAHFCMALTQVCRVFDTHQEGINMLYVLKLVNPLALSLADQKLLQQYGDFCKKNGSHPLVEKYRKWRNNVIAHYNRELAIQGRERFANQHDLHLPELQRVIDLGFEILEWFANVHGEKIKYMRFPEGKDGHAIVLKVLRTAHMKGECN